MTTWVFQNIKTGEEFEYDTEGFDEALNYLADASTGNRTLDAKGIATIACTASNEFVISGSGLS